MIKTVWKIFVFTSHPTSTTWSNKQPMYVFAMWRSSPSIWIWSLFLLTRGSIQLTWPSSSMSAWMYIPCQLAAQLLSVVSLYSIKRSSCLAAKEMSKCSVRIWTAMMWIRSSPAVGFCPRPLCKLQNRSAFLRVFVIVRWDVAIPVAGFRTASASVLAASLRPTPAAMSMSQSVSSPLCKSYVMFRC